MKLENATIKLMKAVKDLPQGYLTHDLIEAYNDCNKALMSSGKSLMRNSGVTIQDISKAFKEAPDLMDADVKGEMRKDWIATVRNFARKDIRDGKLKLSVHRTHSGTNRTRLFIPEPISKTAMNMEEYKKSLGK
jgi:hypothetical protein